MVTMNDAYAPPLTVLPVLAGRQTKGDGRGAAYPDCAYIAGWSAGNSRKEVLESLYECFNLQYQDDFRGLFLI